MKKAVCWKIDKDPCTYGFKQNQIYEYYQKSDNVYFVIKMQYNVDGIKYGVHCCFDKENFHSYFRDLQQVRKYKLYIIQNTCCDTWQPINFEIKRGDKFVCTKNIEKYFLKNRIYTVSRFYSIAELKDVVELNRNSIKTFSIKRTKYGSVFIGLDIRDKEDL